MGFNTTIVILNDALGDIEKDKDFGKKIVAAIRKNSCTNSRETLYSGNGNCGEVVEQHHSSYDYLIKVGGNCGEVQGII